MLLVPTYADDGLISQHVVDFLDDEHFIRAYERGRQTGSLEKHPGDIHFRAYIACWAAKYALSLDGDFVEFGVGRGLLTRAVVDYVDFNSSGRRFFLFDTFEGIPREQASSWAESANMDMLNDRHFAGSYLDEVKETFADTPNIVIVAGKVPESLGDVELRKVAYASIDMNNAAAEIAAITWLWRHLIPGAIVLLDDYAYGPEFAEQKEAWDRFGALHSFTILTLPTGQGLVIKT